MFLLAVFLSFEAAWASQCFVNTLQIDKTFSTSQVEPQTATGNSQQDCFHQFSKCPTFQPTGEHAAGPGYQCYDAVYWDIVPGTSSPTTRPTTIKPLTPECPIIGIPGECICQQSQEYTLIEKIQFNFTLNQQNCCCFCQGDPHCRDFNGKTTDWVVCDNARDPTTCEISQPQCNNAYYSLNDGTHNNQTFQCNYVEVNGNGACLPVGAQPWMKFYEKTYNNGQTDVQIHLGLGGMGNIQTIAVNDGTTQTIVNVNTASGQMQRTFNYWASGFADGIHMTVTLQSSNSRVWRHFDVQLFDNNLPVVTNPSGFCATGVITEAAFQHDKGCTPSDVFIYERLNNLGSGASATQALNAKQRFCQRLFPNEYARCRQKPWYQTLCLAYIQEPIAYIVNPLDLPVDFVQCVNQIQDSPGTIITAFASGAYLNTTDSLDPSTPSCTPYVPSSGKIAVTGQYVYIEMQSPSTGNWNPVFSLSQQQVLCGVSFTVSNSSDPNYFLLTPGSYRVLQCQPIASQTTCYQYGSFSSRITYWGEPLDGPVVTSFSTPFGSLFNDKKIGCTIANCPIQFPVNSNPPTYYQCCQWQIYSVDWVGCMTQLYCPNPSQPCQDWILYFKTNYPKCVH